MFGQDDAAAQNERSGGMPAGSQMLRGTVIASSADAITLKTEGGESYKVTVTTNTRVMKARQAVTLTQIKAGDGVGAMGVMDPSTKTLHALFVSVIDAEQMKRAQADMGKTYIAGEVTAIDDVKLTIKRADGVMQTIAVDEGTSFRRGGRGMGMMMGGVAGQAGAGPGAPDSQRPGRQGDGPVGESITLADVKVGNAVMGPGAVKGGVFVPTELRVADRSSRGRRRAGSADSGPPASTTPPDGVPR